MENDEFPNESPNSNEFLGMGVEKMAAENDSKEIYDWKTTGAEGREKKQMERENGFIHGVQRGDIFEVSQSEENFIMTDNRGRDE